MIHFMRIILSMLWECFLCKKNFEDFFATRYFNSAFLIRQVLHSVQFNGVFVIVYVVIAVCILVLFFVLLLL